MFSFILPAGSISVTISITIVAALIRRVWLWSSCPERNYMKNEISNVSLILSISTILRNNHIQVFQVFVLRR